jgi:death-on-curing family protein
MVINKKKIIKDRKENEIVIFQNKSGALELKVDNQKETIFATQAQMASLFAVDVRTINEHIKNIFSSDELREKTTIRKNRIVQIEGNRNILREINFYNLDMIIAVGYRVNSKMATKFRQWASKILKEHIQKGFTINKKVIAKNYQDFINSVEDVKKFLPLENSNFGSREAFDLVTTFAKTWFSLDAYDKNILKNKKVDKRKINLDSQELFLAIIDLKEKLILKNEATDFFAKDKSVNSLEGIVGNVMQSFGGKFVYESIEEKAAHLIYFIIKNHPFIDGNKRSGAFAFVWFLQKYKRLDIAKISPEALTSLTILIAESNPMHKENLIKLIMKIIET